jgi:hypothetical protein
MAWNKCDRCVSSKDLCKQCKDNPEYAWVPKRSQYQEYIPVCPKGMTDCISDPAYILKYHEKWYHEMYGDKTPEEVIKEKKSCWEEDCYYDDEDK